MKKMLAIVLTLCLALSLVACGGGNDVASNSSNGADNSNAAGVVVQIGPNPETLDPALNSAVDGANVILTLSETLLIVDENNELQPGQAESYSVSEDGLTWTFIMRDGLKWSDGSDLTAKDFEYSFKRAVDPATAAPYGETVMGMVKGYAEAAEGNLDALGVTAVDEKTLVVELAYPCAYFGSLAAFATLSPVQQATVEANGDAWATSAETYVSNGAYRIKSWTPSERIVLEKNPHYNGGWDKDRIVSETITFLLMEDASASYAAYQNGEALLIKEVPTEEIPSFTRVEDGGDYYVDPIMGTYYISMNTTMEIFQDVNVRKALSLAIDREYVAGTLMQGTYTPATHLNGPGINDVSGEFVAKSAETISVDQAANEAAAKAALAEAGYPDGEGFPTITYSTNDSGYHKVVAEYLQQQYKDVLGITLNVEIMEWSSFTPARRAQEYEMARNGWVCDYNDPSNMLELFYSSNGNNDGKYNNPDFDAAMDATKIADPVARMEALHTAEDTVMADYGFIPVAYYNDFWLQSESLQGTWHSPYGYWYLQYAYVA